MNVKSKFLIATGKVPEVAVCPNTGVNEAWIKSTRQNIDGKQ